MSDKADRSGLCVTCKTQLTWDGLPKQADALCPCCKGPLVRMVQGRGERKKYAPKIVARHPLTRERVAS